MISSQNILSQPVAAYNRDSPFHFRCMRRVVWHTAFLNEEISCYNWVVFDFFLWRESVCPFDRSCASIYNNRTNDELNPAVFLRVLWIPLLLSITASSEIANFIESIKQRQLLHKWLKKTGCAWFLVVVCGPCLIAAILILICIIRRWRARNLGVLPQCQYSFPVSVLMRLDHFTFPKDRESRSITSARLSK